MSYRDLLLPGVMACLVSPLSEAQRQEFQFEYIISAQTSNLFEVVAEYSRAFNEIPSVSPLFEGVDSNDDPNRLAYFFELSLPRTGSEEEILEFATEIRDATNFADIHANIPTAVYDSSANRNLCFVDDAQEPPSDKRWSLKVTNTVDAWQLNPVHGGRRYGEDIDICHPDTGWSQHSELSSSRVDLVRSANFVDPGQPVGEDPLDYKGHAGHGTSTGSVIASGSEGEISGAAPLATLVPIRSTNNVVHFRDRDLAKAIYHSIRAQCDVISMSLGGVSFRGLRAAIKEAHRKNIIVLAAAGNCYRGVVAPANYPEVIAVAGVDQDLNRWKGSSVGDSVDISAPAQHVWAARRSSPDDENLSLVEPGEGTSYAVATVAGIAALWLAHHNIDKESYQGSEPLQEVFRRRIAETATVPGQWRSDRLGAGVINAKALLQSATPMSEATLTRLSSFGGLSGLQRNQVIEGLYEGLEVGEKGIERLLSDYGQEIELLAIKHPAEFRNWIMNVPDSAGARTYNFHYFASNRLRSVMKK